eukprot:scaffold145029_cov96-Phaeocystis_antarctica.AAC.1
MRSGPGVVVLVLERPLRPRRAAVQRSPPARRDPEGLCKDDAVQRRRDHELAAQNKLDHILDLRLHLPHIRLVESNGSHAALYLLLEEREVAVVRNDA